jgi:hypothetical protein
VYLVRRRLMTLVLLFRSSEYKELEIVVLRRGFLPFDFGVPFFGFGRFSFCGFGGSLSSFLRFPRQRFELRRTMLPGDADRLRDRRTSVHRARDDDGVSAEM